MHFIVISAGIFVVFASTGGVARAQTSAAAATDRSVARRFTPPRTPWGDPDLQGTFTDKDEMGIPMERPKEFEGKRPQDVTAADLSALVRKRQAQANATAAGIGGGAG